MTVYSTEGKEKGGATIPLFHCFFDGDESITHFMDKFDPALYEALPYLYAVCIAKTTEKAKTVVAGFFIKTSYTHNDPDFMDALNLAVAGTPALQALIGEGTSYLPARISIPGGPPTEAEMLRVMFEQHLKFSD
ncbi:MAG: hypothetical protein WCF68_05440 [Terriglobales bacterium]